jgi:hypothetical protein
MGTTKRAMPVLFVLIFLEVFYVSAQQIDLPSNNPEVMTYFFNETMSLLHYMEDKKSDAYYVLERDGVEYYNRIPFYFSGYGRLSLSDEMGHQYNASFGSVIRLNDYFSIPLFFNSVGGKLMVPTERFYEDLFFNNLYTGSGLIFSNKFGTLGVFAGYYNFFGSADFFPKMQDRNFKFGTIPFLNTTDYPLLKYVLKGIQNYLSFDFHASKLDLSGFTTKIISKPFIIKEDLLSIDSIYYYYKDEYLSAITKNSIHGGGVSLKAGEVLLFEFETGIRKIVETVPGILKYSGEIDLDTNYWFYSIYAGVDAGRSMQIGFQFVLDKSHPNGSALNFLFSIGEHSGYTDIIGWFSGAHFVEGAYRYRYGKGMFIDDL